MTGIPSPAVGVWYLGPLPIRAYAVAILAGIVVATLIAGKRYRARGGPEGALLDAVMWAVPFGIIGARIYHVISSPDRYFGPDGNLALALRIWEGGLGIWGAIPAGALGAWISLRRSGLRLPPLADSIAPALLVAQAIGRLGNYFNQELFGAPTTLPWGLQIDQAHLRAQGLDHPEGTLFHPTFLYELLWCLAMAAVLIYVDRRFRLRHGRVFWLYVALYTLGRLWIEMLRIDEAELVLGLRVNVWVSILVLLAALTAFVVIGRRTRGVEDPIWVPGREPAEADTDGHPADDPESDHESDEADQSQAPDDPVEPDDPVDDDAADTVHADKRTSPQVD
ncbi:prolipoprotein diacylglyceryl transferase [Pseudactinotalea suaedae]|uniref:prolipoprotein diacylglyceryl transferase n=1 Tax=Pseudactinotalea suaedae TaxID=1524924 RepID=UPI0012E2563A|nr:prolipoprotein diacylglyceryl transferase [Pseudactinotalea suaedae]